MIIFIVWLAIISAALAFYLIYLYRKSRQGFRFQVKLTIIFVLLVLVPGIPLTGMISALLTKSMEMFLLPGMDRPLLHSLELMKKQLEREGEFLLSEFENSPSPQTFFNKRKQVCFIFDFEKNGDKFVCTNKLFHPDFSDSINSGLLNSLETIFEQNIFSSFLGEEQRIFQVFQPVSNAKWRLIAFKIDPDFVSVKKELSQSIRVYNSLLLFKNSVIEEQLIWTIGSIFIIVLTLITIYAAQKLSKGISEPILELSRGMKKMAAGELETPVKVNAKDEIKLLVDTFNRMAHDLKESQEKLIRAERMAAWQELARRVSHEIRNSLTPIKLSIRRLWEKWQVEDIKDHPLQSIQEEVESLARLADEFSQFARMPELSPEKTNLHEIIKSVVTLVSSEPGAPKINLDLDEKIPLLLLDAGQFRRVLYNLLKNAIEASQPLTQNKIITVTTRLISEKDRKVKIEIADRGCGIQPEILDKIFEPNFTTKKRGMGLGLSIVKKIIEDHNGEIKFYSTPGKGTRVSIFL